MNPDPQETQAMDDDRHDCPIDGCTKRIPHAVLMCRHHWAKVPRQLQGAVYRAWARGRGAGTDAHTTAIAAAVAAVHEELARESTIVSTQRGLWP